MGHPNELPVPVYETHQGMKVFESPEANGYITLRKQLRFVMEKSAEKIAMRAEEANLQAQLNGLGQPSMFPQAA
jgi:hypothetical protein